MILLTLSAALLPPVQKPPNWSPPEPKMFVGSFPMSTLASGGVATALRLASGVFAAGWRPGFALEDDGRYALYGFRDTSMLQTAPRPAQPLVLYEYEASPFCRKVREACSTLGLRVTMMPCPGARAGFAKALEDAGGKMVVPYLVDPNRDVAMYESDDIIDYLYDTYGPGREAKPPPLDVTAALASIARGMEGSKKDPGARPDTAELEPIELWMYEGSPYARPVRERLTALCLPHTVVASAGSRCRSSRIRTRAARCSRAARWWSIWTRYIGCKNSLWRGEHSQQCHTAGCVTGVPSVP